MMNSILDVIADSFNPGLILLALVVPWLSREPVDKIRSVGVFWICTLVGLVVVYSIQWLDNRFSLWPRLGLDYSTHTAFAVAIITSLIALDRRWIAFLLPALLAYAGMMMYLNYHSLADIVTSALVIAPLVWLIHQVFRGKSSFKTTPSVD